MNLLLMASIFSFAVLVSITAAIFSRTWESKKAISSRLIKYTRVAGEVSPGLSDTRPREKKEEALRRLFSSLSRLLTPRGWRNKAEAELSRVELPLRSEE